MNKVTFSEFVERARSVHGDKYDYSHAQFINMTTKIAIVCPVHGEFLQKPSEHLNGHGCAKCATMSSWTYERCFAEAKKYSSRKEFSKKSSTAYKTAKKEGWIDSYKWMQSKLHSWDYNACLAESKKYDSPSEFKRNCISAYHVASKNGWLKEYTWKNRQWTEKWDYDACFSEAKKYTSKRDFQKTSGSAFNAARKNGWIKDYVWLVNLRKQWDFASCYEEAQKFGTRTEFEKKSSSAYSAARKNNWLDDFTWFTLEMRKPYTDKEIIAIAKTFSSKKEFFKKNNSVFQAARRRNLLDTFDWLRDERFDILTEKIDSVYIYLFKKYNAVYVGRTVCPQERDKQHLFASEKDPIVQFAKNHDCPVPQMQIIEADLTIEEGQEREGYWVQYYLDKGFHVLNKAKTGKGVGSLGSLGGVKWTKQVCYDEARKYKSVAEFRRNSPNAYISALKRQWLDSYTWLTPDAPRKLIDRYDYDSCYHEAKKYNSRTEFLKSCSSCYKMASQNGWIDDYTWFVRPKPNKKWDYDTCMEEAKKYTSRGIFAKKSAGAYDVARKNGWLDLYTWLIKQQKPAGYWTYERCYKEAKKYKTRKDFGRNASTAYATSLKNKWIGDYDWFLSTHDALSKATEKWNYNACYEEAKKYKSRGEFCNASSSAYGRALQMGWLEDYTWLVPKRKRNGFWTYERCMEEAQKYSYREEFRKNCQGGFDAAQRNGWLKEYTWFKQIQKPTGYWNYDTCMEEAKKYTSRNEFRLGNGSAYGVASKNKWLDDYTWFRKKYKKS